MTFSYDYLIHEYARLSGHEKRVLKKLYKLTQKGINYYDPLSSKLSSVEHSIVEKLEEIFLSIDIDDNDRVNFYFTKLGWYISKMCNNGGIPISDGGLPMPKEIPPTPPCKPPRKESINDLMTISKLLGKMEHTVSQSRERLKECQRENLKLRDERDVSREEMRKISDIFDNMHDLSEWSRNEINVKTMKLMNILKTLKKK